MRLVRSADQISAWKKHFANGVVFEDALMVMVVFRTKAEVIKRVLPPPLEPDPMSIGSAYVAEYHKTNIGVAFNEAGLSISAQYNGEPGNYFLSMPVTNDMALVGGREIYGFPKKIAETIRTKREGNKATGVCIRKRIPIIRIEVNLKGPAEPEAFPLIRPNYLYKYPGVPRLVKQPNEIDWGKVELGEGDLALGKSKYDPLHEIPIEEVLLAYYIKGMKVRMRPSEVVAKVDPIDFLPYSFIRTDWPLNNCPP